VRGNLVQISVGSEDGVRAGDRYHIRRGSSYVGMITIDKVYRDQAVGSFDDVHKGKVRRVAHELVAREKLRFLDLRPLTLDRWGRTQYLIYRPGLFTP